MVSRGGQLLGPSTRPVAPSLLAAPSPPEVQLDDLDICRELLVPQTQPSLGFLSPRRTELEGRKGGEELGKSVSITYKVYVIAHYVSWVNHHLFSWSLIYKMGMKLTALSFLQDFVNQLEKCWLKCLKIGNENEKGRVSYVINESQLCTPGL